MKQKRTGIDRRKLETLYCNSGELAEVFRTTERTLFEWRMDGMPFIRRGAKILYDLAKCRKWLEDHHKEQELAYRTKTVPARRRRMAAAGR